jgi:hypothetical protein
MLLLILSLVNKATCVLNTHVESFIFHTPDSRLNRSGDAACARKNSGIGHMLKSVMACVLLLDILMYSFVVDCVVVHLFAILMPWKHSKVKSVQGAIAQCICVECNKALNPEKPRFLNCQLVSLRDGMALRISVRCHLRCFDKVWWVHS